MVRYLNGCRASTDVQLEEVERRYPLDSQVKTLLGIDVAFHGSVDDDITTNEERLRSSLK